MVKLISDRLNNIVKEIQQLTAEQQKIKERSREIDIRLTQLVGAAHELKALKGEVEKDVAPSASESQSTS
jgi:hypothetical protein